MNGLPLTQHEAVASVAQRVCAAEARGLDHEQAISHISIATGIDPEKVRWCVEVAFGSPPVRLSPSPRRRRGGCAIAAAA
jgi:hypothetical protein